MKTKVARLEGSKRPQSRKGSAVIVLLVLLTLMVAMAAANTATLNQLRQRVKMVDQRQIQRLGGSATNRPAAK